MLKKKIIFGGIFYGSTMSAFFFSLFFFLGEPSETDLLMIILSQWLTGFLIFGIAGYLIDRKYKVKIQLRAGEHIILDDLGLAVHAIGLVAGRLFLTNQRLVFVSKGGSPEGLEDIQLPSINGDTLSTSFKVFSRDLKINLTSGLYKSFLADFPGYWARQIRLAQNRAVSEVAAEK